MCNFFSHIKILDKHGKTQAMKNTSRIAVQTFGVYGGTAPLEVPPASIPAEH